MKQRTENYCETKDMLGWLTCVVDEVKRHAPEADTPTLFRARDIAIRKGEIGKLKILSRELFQRLEPGDCVYTVPFDHRGVLVALNMNTVKGWTLSGKSVQLVAAGGCWGWKDLFIPVVVQ